jgi:hypothetical protein
MWDIAVKSGFVIFRGRQDEVNSPVHEKGWEQSPVKQKMAPGSRKYPYGYHLKIDRSEYQRALM